MRAMLAGIVLVGLAGPALAQITKLTPKDIQAQFFDGKAFTAATTSGTKFKMTFSPDGKSLREPQDKAGTKGEASTPVQTASGRGLGPRIALTSGSDAGGAIVSEIFEGTDIRQAIQAIAAQANVSVIIDEGVGGSTSAIGSCAFQERRTPLKICASCERSSAAVPFDGCRITTTRGGGASATE